MEKFYKKFAFNFSDVGMALLILISLLFNANNVNAQAPTFTSTPVTNATAGTPYNYSLFATDPGNNNITFTAPTLPSWLTFSASGQNVATEFANLTTQVGGVAGDASGNIYATELSGVKVYRIAPDGTKTEWATRTSGLCYGMMVYNGYLYLSYYSDSRIDRIPLNNPSAGPSVFTNSINSPLSMVEKDGNIYVASHSPGKIFKIDLSNNNSISTYATVNNYIFGLGFDKQGDLLVAGWSPYTLYKWNGTTISTVATYSNSLTDVKVDAAGYVYISLFNGGGVRKYTPDLSSYVTVHASSSAWGMALTPTGALVFGNNDGKVYRIQTGAVLTGTPTQAHIGTHNVKITANNGTQTADQEFTITVKGLPTIGSFANISKSVGDANFSLTAPTSNSNGAFSYTSSNAGVATISGSTVTITGVGTTTITATQAADGLYTESSVTATLTVGIKPPGNALTFDGSGDFVQIGNANTFDARNMKTIEAWVKFNDLVNEQEIISKSTSSNGLELIIYDRKLAVFAMGGGGPDKNVSYPTSNLVANRWYHVAATHNGANSTLTLYLNGVVIGTTQTPAGMTNSPDPLHLGKWNNSQGNRYFTGSLDEVRIWNVQRTQAQIQAGMYQEMDPATAGLQAYYKFSEGIADGNNVAVTTTLDATANANNGTLNGFTKTGSLSNYTESYATVVPVLQDATEVTGEGFTAKWETPVTGIVNGYLLDVSESSTFASFVTGYQNKDVGNVNEFAVTGLAANKTYYIRVRANKTSVNTQGTYSNVKTAATTKSDQTITFNDLAAKTYGDANFTLSATSTSNLTVTFESSDETIASVSGTTVTIKKAGTVNIIAKQAGNNLYNAASNVSKSLVINQASLTVTAQDATKTYDKVAYNGGNNVTYTGFISGDNAANSVTGTVSYGGTSQGAVTVNNYTIIPSGLSSANYSITYVNGSLTINKAALTVTAQDATKTYDKIAYSGGNNVTYIGFVSGDNAANSVTGTVVYAGTSQGAINVANNYSIIPSGLSSANYAITYGNGTLTINKATLTVTAQNATKTYDKVAYTGGNGISYAGFITGDNAANSVTGTVSYGGTSQGAIAVNNYTIIPSGLSSTNYSITYVNGSLTINKAALTVTAQNATKTYDKVAYSGGNGIAYAGFVTGDNAANSVTGTVSYSGTSQGAVAVNTYSIIPSGLSSANYAITYVNGSLTINKATLTVTAQEATKIYDKVAYTGGNGISYAGFVTGDNATNSVTGTVSYGGTSQGAIAVNNYTIIPSGLSSANYAITYANGTLTINKATLTVTAQDATKTYDKVAYNGGNNVTYIGFITGDNAANSVTGTVSYGGTAQGAINVANNYTIIPSGLSSANYAITYVNGTLTINKATLTVTAQNATKTYDKVVYNGGNGIAYAGFVTGDNASNSVTGTISYGGTAQGAITANTYTIIPSGLSSANYAITYVNGTLTINKAALTVTAQNATKTYNGLGYTGGNGVSYAGFIAGDNETNNVTGTLTYGGTSQNAVNVNSYVITPAGLSSSNYSISYVNGTLTVNKAALVAIAENKARCFGLANPTFTVRYTGFVNNETASVLTTAPVVSTTATTNSAAGNYTLAVAGGAAANYTLTYQNGQLTVYALPVIHIEAGKTSISRGDQIQLVASGGTSYSWANANGIIAGQNGATLTIRPSLTTTYQVTVTNANGCTDTKSFTIEVVEDFKITGTNLLTPNGDGYNDFFVLENIDLYPNNVVKIFDKAGRLVYSKVKYDNTWDGTFNGAPLAEGTYYYIVDFGKGNAVKKGFISIVRNGK